MWNYRTTKVVILPKDCYVKKKNLAVEGIHLIQFNLQFELRDRVIHQHKSSGKFNFILQ